MPPARASRPRHLPSLLVSCLLLLAACEGTRGPDLPFGSAEGTVVIPNAVAGDAANRPTASQRPAAVAPEEAERLLAQRRREAEALWNQAVRLEASDPEEAADLFEDVVDDYPEYEYAAEARFRQGRNLFRAGEYLDAADALVSYMRIAPVNQHLAEVEEMIYESGVRWLAREEGILGIFSTDDGGLDALKYVAETFPAGNYADDALLALGDYYLEDEDHASAVLHYRELLIRYPDSEWSYQARLRLADSYFARDQGDAYHAGFVDVDPRERVKGPEAAQQAPIVSALELARGHYEAYLELMAADPGRAREYAQDIAYARQRLEACRERLRAKERQIAGWYQGRGHPQAADTYERLAAERVGRAGAAVPAPAVQPAPRPAPTPPRTQPQPPPRPVTPPVVQPPVRPPVPTPMPTPVPRPPRPTPPTPPAPPPATPPLLQPPPPPPPSAPSTTPRPTAPPPSPGALPPPTVRAVPRPTAR